MATPETNYLYSICDLLTDRFGPVLEFANDAAAIRAVCNLVKTRPESPIALNPENFLFYRIGRFDTTNGVVVADIKKLDFLSARVEGE